MQTTAETSHTAEFGRGIVGRGIFVELLDYVQLMALCGRDQMIEVVTADGPCRVWFDTGDIVHAEFGGRSGEAAFFHLLAVGVGSFTEHPVGRMPERTIARSSTSLILEAARIADEGGGAPLSAGAVPMAAPASDVVESGKIELFGDLDDVCTDQRGGARSSTRAASSRTPAHAVEGDSYMLMLEQFWGYEGVAGAALVANNGDVLANDLRGADHLLTVAGFYVRGAARLARTLGLGVSEAICASRSDGVQAMVLQLGNAYVLLALDESVDPHALQRQILDPQAVAA